MNSYLSRHLLNGASLIGMHAGKRYARKNGVDLGPGCFIKGLEFSADCKAELVGKPNKVFFRTALEGTPPENAIMIGDVSVLPYNIWIMFTEKESNIKMARSANFTIS